VLKAPTAAVDKRPKMALAARSTRAWLVALAAFAALAATLGSVELSRARADDRSEIARVVRTYERAIMTGDGKTACAQLTDAGRRELLAGAAAAGMGSSCRAVGAAMKRYTDYLIGQAPSRERAAQARRMIENPPVAVTALHGDAATARVDRVSDRPISLRRTGDGWRITGFSSPARLGLDGS
jgi:hypothetical protein